MFKVIQKAGLLIDVAQYIGDINRLLWDHNKVGNKSPL
jgi:hypothetical protein